MVKKHTIKKKRAIKKPARKAKVLKAPSLAAAVNSGKTAAQRIAALRKLPRREYQRADVLEGVIEIMRDKNNPVEVRIAALRALGTASFASPAFRACNASFVAALRELADGDSPELRHRALATLASQHDGYAQRKLLEGLREPSKALLAPEQALQILATDVHSEAYPVARAIASNPPNPTARREALRLLAGDTKSAPLFETILRDKTESTDTRQLSATALHSLDPGKLQQQAREIVMDANEQPELQETCLTALTHFGGSYGGDEALLKRVNTMSQEESVPIHNAARQFLGKYGR